MEEKIRIILAITEQVIRHNTRHPEKFITLHTYAYEGASKLSVNAVGDAQGERVFELYRLLEIKEDPVIDFKKAYQEVMTFIEKVEGVKHNV